MSRIHAVARAAIRAFRAEQDGATMVEYSVMVALIAAVCIVIITTLGGQTNSLFSSLNAAWAAA